MKKILIIGLGIGKLYRTLLENNNHGQYEILTVDIDPNKHPKYLDLDSCYSEHPKIDMALVCCPNYLHDSYITKLTQLNMCDVIVVEKPGLPTAFAWSNKVTAGFPTKLLMVKNNLYRNSLIDEIKKTISDNINDISGINIDWLNVDRIPNPGSWFTNKELAFGGVSRDLMPHLLSIYYGLFKLMPVPILATAYQKYTLDDISKSDYGTITVEGGVYDVDDHAQMVLQTNTDGKQFVVTISAAWKTELTDPKIGVTIIFKNGTKVFYDFGLCPGNAYYKMIEDYLTMDDTQYQNHVHIDTWIHNSLDCYDKN